VAQRAGFSPNRRGFCRFGEASGDRAEIVSARPRSRLFSNPERRAEEAKAIRKRLPLPELRGRETWGECDETEIVERFFLRPRIRHASWKERILKDSATRSREYRKKRIENGKCGFCGRPRQSLKWLRDECARRHREKQRKPKASIETDG
jgi:ribosomal protein L34E